MVSIQIHTALNSLSLHVALEDLQKLRHDPLPTPGGEQGAILEYGGDWLLESARKADPKVGVLRLPWSVDDTAHHRNLKVLHPWM